VDIPYYDVPLPEVGPKGEKPWSLLDNNGGQDIMMWITQGYVADRTQERLSASDRGVSLYRNLLLSNLAKVRRGEDPMNVFRDGEDNEYLDLPSEYWQLSAESARRGDLSRAGGASKYSPVIADALRRAGKEKELVGPVH
jgi:5,5'-dehydrodivanillate O-demethylase